MIMSMRIPAIPGAMILVPCQMTEFIATALIITLRSIKWGYSACLAGLSKASTPPVSRAITKTCHDSTQPSRVRVANKNMRLPVVS